MKAFTSDTPALRWCRKHAQGFVCASVKGFDGLYSCRFEEPVYLIFDAENPSGFEELWHPDYFPAGIPAPRSLR